MDTEISNESTNEIVDEDVNKNEIVNETIYGTDNKTIINTESEKFLLSILEKQIFMTIVSIVYVILMAFPGVFFLLMGVNGLGFGFAMGCVYIIPSVLLFLLLKKYLKGLKNTNKAITNHDSDALPLGLKDIHFYVNVVYILTIVSIIMAVLVVFLFPFTLIYH